jgi:hypothetical protein
MRNDNSHPLVLVFATWRSFEVVTQFVLISDGDRKLVMLFRHDIILVVWVDASKSPSEVVKTYFRSPRPGASSDALENLHWRGGWASFAGSGVNFGTECWHGRTKVFSDVVCFSCCIGAFRASSRLVNAFSNDRSALQ